jgi:beta-barrel assembly-enhancing protease
MRLKTAIPIAAVILFGGAVESRADMFRPGKADQIRLGTEAAQQIRQREKMLPDNDARVRAMRRIANNLLASAPPDRDPRWQYSFDVLQSKELNAFALPGGPIFFYAGLVDQFETEDQFAAVLAHEIIHVHREHWAHAYADQQRRRLGLTALLMLFRANRTVFDLASIGEGLLVSLPYSRRQETEADDMGMDMMIKAGYNPQGMADAFRMLERQSRGGRPPEFLSTHPDNANRVRRIEDRVAKMNREFRQQRPVPWTTAGSASLRAELPPVTHYASSGCCPWH